jgi:hypothetical protein
MGIPGKTAWKMIAIIIPAAVPETNPQPLNLYHHHLKSIGKTKPSIRPMVMNDHIKFIEGANQPIKMPSTTIPIDEYHPHLTKSFSVAFGFINF